MRHCSPCLLVLIAAVGCATPREAKGPQVASPPLDAQWSSLSKPQTDPEVWREVEIAYPIEARRAGVAGTVRLRIVVDPKGAVVDAVVLFGPGHGLDEAALGAIKRFKFHPATIGGAPVASVFVYNYTFVLE